MNFKNKEYAPYNNLLTNLRNYIEISFLTTSQFAMRSIAKISWTNSCCPNTHAKLNYFIFY